MGHGFMVDIVLLLAAGVFFVPLFKRIGLGSVLGYLVAGVLLGPWGTGLIGEPERMSAVSELGVVFLLFIIGLELEPKRLWAWRMPIFGMGARFAPQLNHSSNAVSSGAAQFDKLVTTADQNQATIAGGVDADHSALTGLP